MCRLRSAGSGSARLRMQRSRRRLPSVIVGSTVGCCRSVAYDCLAITTATSQKSWVQDQRLWCCQAFGIGCVGDDPCPASAKTLDMFDCQEDIARWRRSWTDSKRTWCCHHRGIACPRQSWDHPSAAMAFDCDAGYAHWHVGWSSEKSRWCCEQEGRGCSRGQACPDSPRAQMPQPGHDCLADFQSWHDTWGTSKKSWCCSNYGRGCPESSTYDCDTDFFRWEVAWSIGQKAWCCRVALRGCPTTATATTSLRFDCEVGRVDRGQSWSPLKEAWCCQQMGVGCLEAASRPYDCGQDLDTWEDEWGRNKMAWCCEHVGLGCLTSKAPVAFDCSAGFPNWRMGWSMEKKAWCCRESNRGCLETQAIAYQHDCEVDLPAWQDAWSSHKKEWCCKTMGRGCATSASLQQDMQVVVVAANSPKAPCPEAFNTASTASPAPAAVRETTTSAVVRSSSSASSLLRTAATTTTTSTSSTSLPPASTLAFSTTEVQPTLLPFRSGVSLVPPLAPRSLPSTTPSLASVNRPNACPPTPMTCNLNCYMTSSATPVVLPGSVGTGTDVGIANLTLDECRMACRNFPGCEAIVHTSSGRGMCYGKRDVHTSAAEGGCQTQQPYITEMICGAPWGKCTVLGDPHVTPFDRKMLGSHPASAPDEYMVPIDVYEHGEFHLVRSAQLQVRGRFGYTSVFTSAASTLGVVATGPLLRGHTLAVAYVGPVPQTPAYRGWKVMWDGTEILASFPSSFGTAELGARFEDMEPMDFAVRARSTIGAASGLHPSYVFDLGPSKSAQIYVLPGDELCNVVITMRRLPDQQGFCGNFNCDWNDDNAANLKAQGLYSPIPQAQTLFPPSLSSPRGWDTPKGPSPAEIMAACPGSVKQSAGCPGTLTEQESCLFDACVKAVEAVGKKYALEGFLVGPSNLHDRTCALQLMSSMGLLSGCIAIAYLWHSGHVSNSAVPASFQRALSTPAGRGNHAYILISTAEGDLS